MTYQQLEALVQLEAAFKECKKRGLHFCGMDNTFLFATDKCFKQGAKKNAEKESTLAGRSERTYANTAEANRLFSGSEDVGHVDTHGTYEDSGGW